MTQKSKINNKPYDLSNEIRDLNKETFENFINKFHDNDEMMKDFCSNFIYKTPKTTITLPYYHALKNTDCITFLNNFHFLKNEFLDKNMNIFMALTLVFYSLWTVDPRTTEIVGSDIFVWTVPLVIVIFLRYSYAIELGESDGDPVEVLMSDKILIGLVILYILSTIILFYRSLFIGG